MTEDYINVEYASEEDFIKLENKIKELEEKIKDLEGVSNDSDK